MNDDETINGPPPLDCWFGEPDQLRQRLINLMCPRQVCTICGEPRRRITESEAIHKDGRPVAQATKAMQRGVEVGSEAIGHDNSKWRLAITLGWTDCGHDTWRRGIVLDCFGGSGTTAMAASELGRDSISIDIDERNLDLARSRLGMFLVEEETVP